VTSFVTNVLRDSRDLWRANRDLLLRIGGVFYFLPMLAMALLLRGEAAGPVAVPGPAAPDPTPEEAAQALREAFHSLIESMMADAHWLLLAQAVMLLGSATILVLLLDGGRPTVRDALGAALRMLPASALLWFLVSLITAAGAMAFILPGRYAIGRLYLVAPALVANGGRAPFAALGDAIRLTTGRGWLMFLFALAIWIAQFVAADMIGAVGNALATSGASEIGAALGAIGVSAVATAAAIATVLVKAAAYRRLAGESSGS